MRTVFLPLGFVQDSRLSNPDQPEIAKRIRKIRCVQAQNKFLKKS
jgi:hypothetical protein